MAFDFEFYRLISSIAFTGARHWVSTLCNRASQIGVTDALNKDTIYSSPILITRATKLTNAGVITGNDAGLNVKIAIYSATSQDDLTPSNLVLNCGAVNAGTADLFGAIQATLSPAVGFNAGFYWVSVLMDVNHTISTYNNSTAGFAWAPLGFDTVTMQPFLGWSVANTYAGGFPSSYPGGAAKRLLGPTAFLTPSC